MFITVPVINPQNRISTTSSTVENRPWTSSYFYNFLIGESGAYRLAELSTHVLGIALFVSVIPLLSEPQLVRQLALGRYNNEVFLYSHP